MDFYSKLFKKIKTYLPTIINRFEIVNPMEITSVYSRTCLYTRVNTTIS